MVEQHPNGNQTTMLLLPGMDGTSCLFKPFIHKMKENNLKFTNHQLHVHSISYPSDQLLEYNELEQYVITKIKELKDDQQLVGKLVVLGESFSGPIAIGITKHLKIDGLILCCTFASNPRPLLSWPFRMVFPSVSSLKKSNYFTNFMDLIIGLVFRNQFLMSFLSRLFFKANEERKLFLKTMKVTNHNCVSFRLRNVLHVNRIEELKHIKSPLLMLSAGNDWLVPKSSQALIKESYLSRDSGKVLIHQDSIRGSHFLLQDNPDETSQAVWNFIDRHV